MKENFFVYLILNIKSRKTISYVGWTNNLRKRLQLQILVKALNLRGEENGF